MRKLLCLLGDFRGVGAIEYALIASLISVAAVGAFLKLGDEVDSQYVEVDQAMTSAR